MLIGAGFAGALGDQLGVIAMFNVMSCLYILAGVLALTLLPKADEEPGRTLQFRVQPAYIRVRPAYR
jgi:hypothetical protein